MFVQCAEKRMIGWHRMNRLSTQSSSARHSNMADTTETKASRIRIWSFCNADVIMTLEKHKIGFVRWTKNVKKIQNAF